MFDEPPVNLPVEKGKAPPPQAPPRQPMPPAASPAAKPETPVPAAPAEPGTSRTAKAVEPEDMFAGMEESAEPKKPGEAVPATAPLERKKGGAGKIIGILVAILVLLGVIGGGLWYFFLREAPPAPVPVVPEPTPTVVEEPPALPPEPPPAIPPPVEILPEEPEPEPPPPTIPESAAIPAPDTDHDGLTDPEEAVFGTDAALTDSDGDTFADGTETANGYDPALPGARLADSPRFRAATVAATWDLFLPVVWTVEADTSVAGDYIVRTGTVNTITLHPDQKPAAMPFDDWLAANDAEVDLAVLESGDTDAGLSYWITPDGRTAYITDGNAILVLRLMTNGSGSVDFPAIFRMAVKTAART